MEKLSHLQGQNNPSFSSSLLDAIYRSIDEPDAGSPRSALSSAFKRQITSIEKNCTPKPPPPANHRHHSSSSYSSNIRHDRHCSDPPPETKTPSSIRSKISNLRNLRAPASPGTRLAAFLNAIFAGGGGKAKKAKFAGGPEESARSCIKKMPEFSKGGREKRHCGEVPAATRDRRLLVEELMRGLNMEEEESDCESASSEELFELESLSAIGRFRDGLPVYETTNVGVNRAVDHGFISSILPSEI